MTKSSIPVVEIEPGVFVRWQGGMLVRRTVREARQTTSYADGRRDEIMIAVDPYEVEERLVTLGSMDAAALSDYRIAAAEPFVASAGKRATGEERFAPFDGVVRQVFDEEEIPPPPEPTREEKAAAFLAGIGLTKEDFAAVLLGEATEIKSGGAVAVG